MTEVFIDGSAGTTGLRIRERLSQRPDLHLITLPEELRKDASARKEAINRADVAFLCLPDAAAIEAEALVENPSTVIIDTSTAHRTAPGWTYGFPEIAGLRTQIAKAKRIANPGCHASGFIALVQPLREAGLLSSDIQLTAFSLTGYTGGGKKMIAEYSESNRDSSLDSPRQYGLTQKHKHLPEMGKLCQLDSEPVFCPIVADFPCGMEVTVPIFASQLHSSPAEIREIYRKTYNGPVVHFDEAGEESGFAAANCRAGFDDMHIMVAGNDRRILLISRFDNLGKGASGAAIQNMNIALGLPETAGLVL